MRGHGIQIVVRAQHGRITGIRQWIEPILDGSRDRIDRTRRDASVGVELARERIADLDAQRRKVAAAPCLERHRRIQGRGWPNCR